MTEISKNRSECQTCQRANYHNYDKLSLIQKTDVSIVFVPKSCNMLSIRGLITINNKNKNNTA